MKKKTETTEEQLFSAVQRALDNLREFFPHVLIIASAMNDDTQQDQTVTGQVGPRYATKGLAWQFLNNELNGNAQSQP